MMLRDGQLTNASCCLIVVSTFQEFPKLEMSGASKCETGGQPSVVKRTDLGTWGSKLDEKTSDPLQAPR